MGQDRRVCLPHHRSERLGAPSLTTHLSEGGATIPPTFGKVVLQLQRLQYIQIRDTHFRVLVCYFLALIPTNSPDRLAIDCWGELLKYHVHADALCRRTAVCLGRVAGRRLQQGSLGACNRWSTGVRPLLKLPSASRHAHLSETKTEMKRIDRGNLTH